MTFTGTTSFLLDFIDYEVHDNSIFVLRPGQVHRLELKAGTTGFLMEFDLTFYHPNNNIAEQRWKKAIGKNYCKVEAERFMKLHSFLSILFNEFTTKQHGYKEAIKAMLDVFFIEYTRQSLHPQTMGKFENGYTQERFETFIQLLETNIGSMKNVSAYADALSLSSYQLNAITKTVVGKPVSELINDQIILEVKRYLLATSNQVKDVADHLGYEDVSYFIRFFKKHTGHSPELFRKNFK
jgi:AraC family transcriptional regulator, transcriptional activator of pobA